jgi:hypothetical protein
MFCEPSKQFLLFFRLGKTGNHRTFGCVIAKPFQPPLHVLHDALPNDNSVLSRARNVFLILPAHDDAERLVLQWPL